MAEMSNDHGETLPHEIQEIIDFVKNILLTNINILSNKHVDLNMILQQFSKESSHNNEGTDSGFESDYVGTSIVKKKIPVLAKTISFSLDNHDFDVITEKSLEHLCLFLQKLNIRRFSVDEVEKCLQVVIALIQYLDESKSSTCYQDICKAFIESLLNERVSDDHLQFQFSLEICRRIGNIKCLNDIVINILLEKLQIISENLRRNNYDPALTFMYEADLVCSNSILLLLDKVRKKYRKDTTSPENEEAMFQLMENLTDADDFFYLSFLSFNIAA